MVTGFNVRVRCQILGVSSSKRKVGIEGIVVEFNWKCNNISVSNQDNIFVSRYCNKYKSVIGSIDNSYSDQNNKSTKEIHRESLKKEFGKLINLDSCNKGYSRINTEQDMVFK